MQRITREEEIKNKYFENLCELVEIGGPTHRSFLFAKSLFEKEFYGILPNDGDREEDGRDLRPKYCGESYTAFVERALEGPCSMLEMLIALAERIDEMLSSPSEPTRIREWFWEMVYNLGLKEFHDRDSLKKRERFNDFNQRIIDKFLRREYSKTGDGGLFPQSHSRIDSRYIEIWYQMQAYYIEKFGY